MAAVSGDGLVQFKEAVQALESKSKPKISSLTVLADGQYDFAQDVAEILLNELAGASASRIQPLIFVVDSILKKVGKDYRAHFGSHMPEALGAVRARSDASMSSWLEKMINSSWRKYDLLPAQSLDRLDQIFASPPGTLPLAAAPAPATGSLPPAVEIAAAGPASSSPAMASAAVASAAAAAGAPQDTPGVTPPPMKAPPPQRPAAAAAAAAAVAAPGIPAAGAAVATAAGGSSPTSAATAVGPAAGAAELSSAAAAAQKMSPELVERRLGILTKIIERRHPSPDELQEIMKVPQIRCAITMQQKGERKKAMGVLSEFKQELERMHGRSASSAVTAAAVAAPGEAPRDPRQPADASRRADSRQAERAVDPRQPESRSATAQDPRQPPADPRQRAAGADDASGGVAEKRPGEGEAGAAQAKRSRSDAAPGSPSDASPSGAAPDASAASGGGGEGEGAIEVSDDEGQPGTSALVPARQILQGLPTIGFSEAWLRQFMEQMPTKAPPHGGRFEAPCIGRKVLGASGEQMVYVDELSPNEMMLLLQLIFLLEERLRRTGGGVDVSNRIPHTFSYLQVDAAVDVMIKRLFSENPFQCTTTGLRFNSQDKLKKHQDGLYRKKAQAQKRQHGAEARGWMESIPEWVGNRDLVVGPALFRLGEAREAAASAAQEAQSRPTNPGPDDEDPPDGEPGSRWHCPFDERRAVCPISGEPLERTWSSALNSWAFADAVAVEPGSTRPLRFPPGGPVGPRGLSETAVLFKKSCFFNTPTIRQLEALEQCRAPLSAVGASSSSSPPGGAPSSVAASAVSPAEAAARCAEAPFRTSMAGVLSHKRAAGIAAGAAQDPALAALAAVRPLARRSF